MLAMKDISDSEFHNLIETIRRRPNETVSGQWFNVITFGTCTFIQGNIYDDDATDGVLRNTACLVDTVSIDEIAGFWPEIRGHPITISEESALVDYIESRGAHEVELIVPERNVARPVDWDRFDETSEYALYKEYIYPAIVEAIEGIDYDPEMGKETLGTGSHITNDFDENVPRLLDIGCGTGDLIEDINSRFFFDSSRKRLEYRKDDNPSNVMKNRIPRFECYGVDINPANIDAAEEKSMPHIHLGDGEDIDKLFPPEMNFDLIIFSGLLNRQVVNRDKALRILDNSLIKLNMGGHIIITGYTSCHFTADDLAARGLTVLRKSIPRNLFKDYINYYLRQLYLGRKIN